MSESKQVLEKCLRCCAGDEAEHCIICGRLLALKEELKKKVEELDTLPKQIMNVPGNHAYYGVLIALINALDNIERIELEER